MADEPTEWARHRFESRETLRPAARGEGRAKRQELFAGWLNAVARQREATGVERMDLQFTGPFGFVLARRCVSDVRAAVAATGLPIDVKVDRWLNPRWVKVAVRRAT